MLAQSVVQYFVAWDMLFSLIFGNEHLLALQILPQILPAAILATSDYDVTDLKHLVIPGAINSESFFAFEAAVRVTILSLQLRVNDVRIDVLVQSHSAFYFNLSVDYFAGQLTEVCYFWNTGVAEVFQEESFSPEVFEEVELLELLIIDHKEVVDVVGLPC